MMVLPQTSPYGAHCLTVFASISVSVWLPRLVRLAFCVRAIKQCRFMPGPASTLPVAVILNRFLTDDLVFILGICTPFREAIRSKVSGRLSRPGMPIQARSRRQGAGYSGGWGRVQGRVFPDIGVVM